MSFNLSNFFKGTSVKEANLKRDLFSRILYATILTMSATLILGLLLQKHLYFIITNVAILIFLAILLIIRRLSEQTFMQKRIYVTFCFVMGCFLLPLLYIFGGGIHSGIPLLFMMIGITTILLLDNITLVLIFASTVIVPNIAYYLDQELHYCDKYTVLGDFTFIDIALTTSFVGPFIGLFLRDLINRFEENQTKANDLLGRIENAATKDPLTGAYNRRYLIEYIDSCIAQVDSGELGAFSILMFDIDHFKNVNDTYGHLAGDDCIKSLALILQSSLRKVDVVSRYGGEEFICVLPSAEDTPAFRRAEQIRTTVENTILSQSIDKKITVSGGVAMYKPGMTAEELIEAADSNLYIAKENGRNQIVWHNGGIPPLVYAVYGASSLQPVHNSGRRFSDATKF
ncbi:MAG: GGDEF domain-containing protein [Oscillospiraceae bacterium]|nr:GGDEF domain-containing protein [Candidatus Limimonas coprohippi]